MIEAAVHGVQIQESHEHEVVLQTLAELALAADGKEGHQQMIRWDGGPSVVGVHPVEDGRELG